MAQNIYKNQPLTVTLDTKLANAVLAAADNVRIRYKTPSGTIGYKTATVSGTEISSDFTGAEINESGNWEFRAWVIVGAGESPYPGTPLTHQVQKV